jgi:hypothetical protein
MATPPLGTDIGSDEEASLIEYVEGLEEGRVPDYRFLKSWGVQRLKLPPRMLRQGIDWQAFWLDDETIDEYWRLLVERHGMIRNLASSQQPPPRCVFLASNTAIFRKPTTPLPEHWAQTDKLVRSLGSESTQHWTLGVVNLVTKRWTPTSCSSTATSTPTANDGVAHPVYREILPKYTCVVACKIKKSRLHQGYSAQSLEGAAPCMGPKGPEWQSH